MPDAMSGSTVSAVIPTFKRPYLVLRAVRSALAQTHKNLEVIVVIDGVDPVTRNELIGLADPRVRVFETGENAGACSARNMGIREAQGTWVALLDDDDEWLPNKLQQQLELLQREADTNCIAAARVIVRTPLRDFVWPDYPFQPREDISEYLLDRPTAIGRPGFIQTSSILAHRSVFLAIPFQEDLEVHQDWTFVIEACRRQNVRIRFAWEPLSIYHFDPDGVSLSRHHGWEVSYLWAHRYRHLLTGSAFSAFILSKVAGKAKRQHSISGLAKCCWAAIFRGRIRMRHLAIFLGICVLPKSIIRRAAVKSFGTPITAGPQGFYSENEGK